MDVNIVKKITTKPSSDLSDSYNSVIFSLQRQFKILNMFPFSDRQAKRYICLICRYPFPCTAI